MPTKRNIEELKDLLYTIADLLYVTKNLRQAVEMIAPDVVDTYDTRGDWAEAFIEAGVPERFRKTLILLNEMNMPYEMTAQMLKRLASVLESQYKIQQASNKELFQPKLILFITLASIMPLFLYVLPMTADSLKKFVQFNYPFQTIISTMSPSLKLILSVGAGLLSLYVVFFTPFVKWLLQKTLWIIPSYRKAVQETERGLFFSNLALYVQGTRRGLTSFLEEFYDGVSLERLSFLTDADRKILTEVLTTDVLLSSVDTLENYYRSAFTKAETLYTTSTQGFVALFTTIAVTLFSSIMLWYTIISSNATMKAMKSIGGF